MSSLFILREADGTHDAEFTHVDELFPSLF